MKKDTQPATRYASVSDAGLKEMFRQSKWSSLNEDERLDLLQEVVNREAKAAGGQYACKVEFSDLPSNTAGEQQGNTIRLNREMFTKDQLTEQYGDQTITYRAEDANYQAYETVLHEHRHVQQDLIAAGVIPSDPQTKEICQANAFTSSDVDGTKGSQYLLGVTDYSLYYLNPTELDAYKTSQTAAGQLAAEHLRAHGSDASIQSYAACLQREGYEARLAEYRELYQNKNVDKDVSDVLVKMHRQSDVPTNEKIEQIVKKEMIESQKLIDLQQSKELDQMENQQTYTENGFTFVVGDTGTATATGPVSENPASRSGMQSIRPDGYDSQLHDKGHLIAARQGGPATGCNVTAQDRTLNRGAYKTAENAEVRLANNGYAVETEKTAYVSNAGDKPDAYMINDTITTPEGETQHVHLSFQNASPEEQEEWNRIADMYSDYDEFDNPDAARESMSKEQYASLMEETDRALPSVRDEYDMGNRSETSFSSAGPETNDGASVSSGADNGCDSGIDMA